MWQEAGEGYARGLGWLSRCVAFGDPSLSTQLGKPGLVKHLRILHGIETLLNSFVWWWHCNCGLRFLFFRDSEIKFIRGGDLVSPHPWDLVWKRLALTNSSRRSKCGKNLSLHNDTHMWCGQGGSHVEGDRQSCFTCVGLGIFLSYAKYAGMGARRKQQRGHWEQRDVTREAEQGDF